MRLSNYEKETIINFSEADKTASVYTHNEAMKAQLSGLCGAYPKQARQTGDNGYGGMTFELPKKWLKIKPPRVLSEKQLEVLKRMNESRKEPACGLSCSGPFGS